MSSITDLLSSIEVCGGTLWVQNGTLNCRSPRGALTSEQLSELRKYKDEIIAIVRDSQGSPTRPLAPAVRTPSGLAPLTIQQEMLWKMIEKYPTAHCLIKETLRMSGDLVLDFLRQSISEVERRHESLRTRFVVNNGVAMQKIEAPSPCTLEVVDLTTTHGRENLDTVALGALQKLFSQPMDVTVRPPFRVWLLKLTTKEYRLLVAAHHIISDGVSLRIVIREVLSRYRDLTLGRRPSLPNVDLQYADYAIWQRNECGSWLNYNSSYWKKKLEGAKCIQWPADDGAKVVAPCFESIEISFSEELTAALEDLAKAKRVTLALMMHCIYCDAVSVFCHQLDFVVPVIVSGRRVEPENITGYFVYPLPLRIVLTGDESLADSLSLVTQEFLIGLDHMDFGEVANKSPPELWSGGCINWEIPGDGTFAEVYTPSDWDRSDANIKIEEFPFVFIPDVPKEAAESVNDSPRGIALLFRNTRKGICAMGLYRSDLISADFVQRFSQDLLRIAEQFARDPSARLVSLRGQ